MAYKDLPASSSPTTPTPGSSIPLRSLGDSQRQERDMERGGENMRDGEDDGEEGDGEEEEGEEGGAAARLLPSTSSTSNGAIYTPSKTDSSGARAACYTPTHTMRTTDGGNSERGAYADDPTSTDGYASHKPPTNLHDPSISTHPPTPTRTSRTSKILFAASVIIFSAALLILGQAAWLEEGKVRKWCYRPDDQTPGDVPEYFDWRKQAYRGVREEGAEPMLAEEPWLPGLWGGDGGMHSGGGVPAGGRDLPGELGWGVDALIEGRKKGDNSIWNLMGHLSPWGRPDDGFGVDEIGLPPGSEVKQVHLLHRHGARYPTSNNPIKEWGQLISAAKHGGFTANLTFLNTWTYKLGAEILVPFGRQQLFTSGMSHRYKYGRLIPTISSSDSDGESKDRRKIVARTTTQDRMIDSATHFLAGFFGPQWEMNVTLETIIESDGFNNSLAGYLNCPNANRPELRHGTQARNEWVETYLANATERLQALSPPSSANFKMEWTPQLAFAAQQLCPYETISLGYSHFCTLFNYEEWRGFEHAIDLEFDGDAMFGSPTAKAVGAGWVNELLARLKGEVITEARAQVNVTLDEREETFPTVGGRASGERKKRAGGGDEDGQKLWFDFSHDTNIASVLTAMGLTQFQLNTTTSPSENTTGTSIANIVPFAAHLALEIIAAPKPVKAHRLGTLTGMHGEKLDAHQLAADAYEDFGTPTRYVRLLINERTVPLGRSWEECGERRDGWCEFGRVVERLGKEVGGQGEWEKECFGGVKDGRGVD